MIPLTNKDIKSYEKQKVCQIYKKEIRDYDKYDDHFIIKKLTEEFKGDFESAGENTQKYITFPVPLKQEDDGKITYKLKFIDSCRSMLTPLSNLVDNVSGVYDKECKKCMEKKN